MASSIHLKEGEREKLPIKIGGKEEKASRRRKREEDEEEEEVPGHLNSKEARDPSQSVLISP